MHELGVVIEVVKTVEEFARANGVTKIDTLVLQIGELSSMVPTYIADCFPAAVDGTFMSGTKLAIEIIPGNARCANCGKVFNVLANKNACPECGPGKSELLSGKELMIKEILAC
jgi:hydrogenase nickel incorporation protein HypA/HybF